MSGCDDGLSFDSFLAELRGEPDGIAFIELDREEELEYLTQHRYRFDALLDALAAGEPPRALLDVGTTPFTLYLSRALEGTGVCTVDLTELLRERCERDGVEFHRCDLAASPLPFADDRFDVVLFTEVLEHLVVPPSVVLPELRRVLRPGGALLASVPNIATLARRTRFLLGHSPLEGAESQLKTDWVHGRGHVHEFTRVEVAALFESHGFTVERISMLEPPLRQTLRRLGTRWPRRGFQLAGAVLSVWCPAFRRTIQLECRTSA